MAVLTCLVRPRPTPCTTQAERKNQTIPGAALWRSLDDGINAAISSRASSIGFAVPINGASSVLPQLRARGKVSRGYMGVGLRDVDADLERSLKLTVDHGALVQDITSGSPADRAGLRPYDVITSLDDRTIANDDQLIREISARAPGSAARLHLVRDGRDQTLTVKLAERPARDRGEARSDGLPAPAERGKADQEGIFGPGLGIVVRDLDQPAPLVPRHLRLEVGERISAAASASGPAVGTRPPACRPG